MNILTEPSFESGGAAWLLSGTAQVRSDLGAYDGSSALYMLKNISFGQNGAAIQTGLDLTLASSFPVAFYAKKVGSGGTYVRVQVDDGLGSYNTLGTVNVNTDSWTLYEIGTLIPLGTTGGIWISTVTEDGAVLVDLVRVGAQEANVAILLAERAVRTVIATLKANLPTELTSVVSDMDTEYSETVALTAPANANYYAYPKAEVAGAAVHVEVFESAFETLNPYTDAASARATFTCPLTVRLTHFNRDGSTAATMMQRMRLYGAALHRVLLEQYTLGGSDTAIKLCVPRGYSPLWEFEGEDSQKVVKVQVVINAEVSVEEVSA